MTQPDEPRHAERALSVKQRNAIELLLAGNTDAEAAEAVGVTRQTVNGWRNHDADFLAELNARRKELWGAQGERLRRLVSKAVDVLENDLADSSTIVAARGLRQSAAVHVLRAVGLYGEVKAPWGETDPEAIRADWEERKRQAALDALIAKSYEATNGRG